MKAKRPTPMKSTVKAASGGAIVIAVILALFFFKGPGLGSGDGTSDNNSTAMATTQPPGQSTNTTTPPLGSDTIEPKENGGLTQDEEKALSGHVLAILIDEHNFLMEVPTDSGPVYRPAEIKRLLELAKLADGDSNGIRIRLLRRENARASAEEQLTLDLSRIGIQESAIHMPADFIP